MSRLFTFGCSYTMWPWPTWADIVAHELKLEHHNWALPGLGNVGIASRMLECDLTHKFNDDDIILVVWSSWTREDRFNVKKSFSSGWSRLGDVHHTYDKDFIHNHWSLSNDLIKNSTSIIQSNRVFDIKFNGHIQSLLISDHKHPKLGFDDNEIALAKFYEPHIPNDGMYDNEVYTCKYERLNENHPDVLSHMSYVIEYIMPKLNLTLSSDTIDYFTGMDSDINQFTNSVDSSDRRKFMAELNAFLLSKYSWAYQDYVGFN